jgi:hypothetical protein
LDIRSVLPVHNILKRLFLELGSDTSKKRSIEDGSIQLTGCKITGFPLKRKFDTIFWRNNIATVMSMRESSSSRTILFLGKPLPSAESSIGYPLWMLSPTESSETWATNLLCGSNLIGL